MPCRKEVIKTKFGALEGNSLEKAKKIYTIFYEGVNKGEEQQYALARQLYSNPLKFLLTLD